MFRSYFVWELCIWSVSMSTICNDANTSLSFTNPFVSVWKHMKAQEPGPFYICHNLGSYPAKVEVQVKVQTQNNGEQIFLGVGSAQRDDDMDIPYGGIVYLYNTTHVILFVPKDTQKILHTDKGTLAYTVKGLDACELPYLYWVPKLHTNPYKQRYIVGSSYPAFKGAFIGNFTKVEVRIKAWNLQELSTVNFETNISFSTSKGYLAVPHDIGRPPAYVTVQVEFNKAGLWYISEAEGANFHSIRVHRYDAFGGFVYAYNDTTILLWTPKKGYLFFAADGWGKKRFLIKNGIVTIRTWSPFVVISEQYVSKDVYSDDTTDEDDYIMAFDQCYDIDKNIIVALVNPLEPENNDYVFHGVGTALTEGSFGKYGGIIYSYNQTHTLLWIPSSSSKRGHMAYLGGVWISNAKQAVVSSRAKIFNKIINLSDSPNLCSKCEIDNVADMVHILDIPDVLVTGTNVTYACKTNNRLILGNLNRTCLSNGKWSGKTPICKRCQCPCTKTKQQVYIETKEELESKIAATTKSLTMKKSNLSTQTRKKISAKDTQSSATYIGIILGFGVLIISTLTIVISDIPLIAEHIRYGPRKGRREMMTHT